MKNEGVKSVLALSLGTYCGWARVDVQDRGDTAWSYGSWICSGTPSARLETFRDYLDRQFKFGVDKLFVYGRKGKMLNALNEACIMLGVPCQPLNIIQVRQFATGSGRADTVALALAVRRWGFAPTSAKAATAIACLQWVFKEGAFPTLM